MLDILQILRYNKGMNIYNDEWDFLIHHGISDDVPETRMHIHNHNEIFWYISGSLTYSVEGNIYNVEKGDIMITNMREFHAPIFTGSGRYERRFIQFKPSYLSEFTSEGFQPFACFENRKPGVGNLIPAKIAREKNLHQMMTEIESYFKSGKPESEAMIKSYMVQLLVNLSDIMRVKKNVYRENKKITAVIRHINNNLAGDLSLAALEREFFMSRFHLAHLFKEQTGVSLKNYIDNKRVIKSKELILNKVNLSDIPEMVGYGDYSVFYRNFKKITEKSPREFSKMQ